MSLQSQTTTLEGILLIDKPTGCTSHDVVDRLRRKLHMKRIGHAGTLDPLATGLLIMLVGKATKASQFLMSLSKTYEGTMRLGVTTTSQDSDGDVVEEKEVPTLSEEQFKDYMKGFLGDQYQTPPMFSAKKVDGVPLYKLAREGKSIEREPRFINISSFDLLSFNLPEASFSLSSSKGTYVRTVVHDLGQKIGCGAHLNQLRRTAIDKFSVNDSVALDKLEEMSLYEIRNLLIPVYKAVPRHVV